MTRPNESWARVIAVIGGLLAALPMVAFVVTGVTSDKPIHQINEGRAVTRCETLR